jgi:hypothetical protein
MKAILWLVAISAVVHGILAGLSFDVAAVKLPTRKRIGAVAYANFARGNDLGNGRIVYPAGGILAITLVFGTTIGAYFAHSPSTVTLGLIVACIGTIAHSACTAVAAPIMLSLKDATNEVAALTAKLDKFAGWHTCRAVFQFLTFVVLVWTLVETSRVF